MGESAEEAFDSADKIFAELLKENSSSEITEQYGYLLYQRANCLLSECENQLSRAKMQGIASIPFDYLKKYISPATILLHRAQEIYPQSQRGDLFLLELDLFTSETHIWQSCGQKDAADRSRSKALNLISTAQKDSSLAADTRKKLLLRKAMLLCESTADSGPEIRKTLTDAVKIESGNVELDISVFTFYAKYVLDHGAALSDAEYGKLEQEIQKSAARIELLREQNLKDMDFVAKKNYFATRTELYEVLLMLYAKRNRPFEMMLAMDRVRSRAIQDEIIGEKVASQAQLQKILAENRGMLLAYYVGCDHIWTVCFTGDRAEIARSKRSGQELAAMCRNIIQVYSDFRHPQMYMRHGPNYRPVPEAFAMSHAVYDEIFMTWHRNFRKDRLDHLYIIPHNVLNYLPFSALAVKPDLENVFKTVFVADDGIPVSYLTSVNSLLASGKGSANAGRSVVFARGDYSFPASYRNDPENPDNPAAPPLNLPNASAEGATVAKLLNVPAEDLFAEKNASEFHLMQSTAKACDIVHIASHAHLNALSPLESYVVLTAGHGEDGKVKVRELLARYRKKMHADLLVLSACDTNRGEANIAPGDDIAALSNAFLVAGAGNVVATAWPASDDSFPKIMEQFYSNIQKGMAKDAALAHAVRTYISQKDQVFMRYPIFWGNIVLNGGLQKK